LTGWSCFPDRYRFSLPLPPYRVSIKKYQYRKKKYLPTIRHIPDSVWNEVKDILPEEKPSKTVGRPAVSFRTVMDGILYILRTGCQWKMLPREYGSGSTCHRRFQEWVSLGIFQKLWVRLLQIYNSVRGIKWRWQSLDSASVKAPLGGTRQAPVRQIEARQVQKGTF